MRRRDFVGVVTIATIGLVPAAAGQTKGNLPTIGLLLPMKEGTELARLRQAAFRAGLAAEGFVDGSNYSLVMRFLEGDFSRVEPVVRELGLLKPRVAAIGAMGISAFHQQYPETPVVFTGVAADPIALGWVQSYVHPGGMLTGNVMNAVGGEETMAQKRLEFFKELVPDASKIGIVGSGTNPLLIKEKEALQKIAGRFGFELLHYNITSADDLESAFAAGLRDNVSAFYISGEPLMFSNLSRVITFVTSSRKPTYGPYPEWGRAGLLMSYAQDPLEGYRNAGVYTAKILKGAKPGDLPIQQASKFILVINQRAARSLAIVIPPSLLALADEVID
ncbi:putative ABC transport system substrate-binding protein [Bradyrhizobium sp. Rc2d]|uniref:ABC transporter substrate-binding protein n=1 Tax=Bradyrhizobium sp. Rc2d TaxID=1855321 RepID=UPI00088B4690|nr:ABC transporter substrate-binding protein [Bradyrhizobium sp. Rc2d]SDG44532.1 putative ABC transport system substrate-binding protein [Bradyrhizobium sp. Rc2d]